MVASENNKLSGKTSINGLQTTVTSRALTELAIW